MTDETVKSNSRPLRVAAEALLAENSRANISERNSQEILHELQVHEIELEMQNESLRQAQHCLEESRDRYVDLYDFAPVGYLTLTHDALISEINLTAATLLGEDRLRLLRRRFAAFVVPEDKDVWYRHLMRVALHGENKSCEITLLRRGDVRFIAQMVCLSQGRVGETAMVRIALTDITERKRAEAELHTSEERFRRLAQISPVGIFHIDAHGLCSFVNQRWVDITGLSLEDSLADGWLRAWHPEDRKSLSTLWQQALNAREPLQSEWRMQRPDGTTYWVLSELAAEHDAQGKALGYIGIINDITERKRAEEELRIAAIAFEGLEGMMVTDAKGIILRVNKAFERTTGYSAQEAVGRTMELLCSGRHDKNFYQTMWQQLKEKGHWQGEVWHRRKNGKVYAEWLAISAVTAPAGETTHYVGTFSDITQNSEAEAEIHRLAYYDALTQLPNRRLLQDRLRQAVVATTRSGMHGAILFVDLDNFKMLNDTRGHEVGDLLLIEVAQRLHGCVRAGDTLARLGGDEFVIILEELSSAAAGAVTQAKQLGEKLLDSVAKPYHLHDCEYYCTASMGISLFSDEHVSIEKLLMHADLSMYQAKDSGRNTLRFFDPGMQSSLDERSLLESDLRQACGENQLKLYYQPQINNLGEVVGAEALLRWEHPERGIVGPDQFISLAEETGLILTIGHWVLRAACAQIKAWEGHGATRNLKLAVNVSARQFRQRDFVLQVEQALQQLDIDPTLLKIELTESVVLDNVRDAISKIQELKLIGVGLSMDDFGTGHSSLSYLKQLPLDQLKIDRSFICGLPADGGDAAIVQAIITMGKTFGLNVIAEGVESTVQRDFLLAHGCDGYQGNLFSPPVQLPAFEEFLRRHEH